MGASWLIVCVTHRQGLAIFLGGGGGGGGGLVIILNFCFKEFRFGLHADSLVLVDFLHVFGSIEGR